MECGHKLRTGNCKMDGGHKGRHSTVTFVCDVCGKTRRGQPIDVQDGRSGEVFGLCFMCVGAPRVREWGA